MLSSSTLLLVLLLLLLHPPHHWHLTTAPASPLLIVANFAFIDSGLSSFSFFALLFLICKRMDDNMFSESESK